MSSPVYVAASGISDAVPDQLSVGVQPTGRPQDWPRVRPGSNVRKSREKMLMERVIVRVLANITGIES
jgi:hypothetical protein